MAVLSSSASAPANPWVSVDYVRENADVLVAAVRQHVELVGLSVLAGLVVSVPLALLVRGHRRGEAALLGTTGVLYTIPSLALFAVLAPVTGLTVTTVVIGLTGYTLLLLVRNILTGLAGVPADVREAAVGMGMGRTRLLLTIELPLALPAILAGIRVATVSTVALATVGVVVSNGGLGQLIFEGLNRNLYRAEILTATVLCVLLAGAAELGLLLLERLLTPWTRR